MPHFNNASLQSTQLQAVPYSSTECNRITSAQRREVQLDPENRVTEAQVGLLQQLCVSCGSPHFLRRQHEAEPGCVDTMEDFYPPL